MLNPVIEDLAAKTKVLEISNAFGAGGDAAQVSRVTVAAQKRRGSLTGHISASVLLTPMRARRPPSRCPFPNTSTSPHALARVAELDRAPTGRDMVDHGDHQLLGGSKEPHHLSDDHAGYADHYR